MSQDSHQIHKHRSDNEDSSKYTEERYFMRVHTILKRIDTGSALSWRKVSYTNSSDKDLPDEETQTQESLENLANGNYEDFTVEDYLKHIRD